MGSLKERDKAMWMVITSLPCHVEQDPGRMSCTGPATWIQTNQQILKNANSSKAPACRMNGSSLKNSPNAKSYRR